MTHTVVNFHFFAVMLGVLWACEMTMYEQNEAVKYLFRLHHDSRYRDKTVKVQKNIFSLTNC
jgi:hypothetical protein